MRWESRPRAIAAMYEHRSELLPTRTEFFRRVVEHALVACGILAVSLGFGVLGYHGFEGLPWLDALLNASMILGGMGPVDRMETDNAKIFAALYALFSGLAFIGVTGIALAPWVHRLFHWIHLDEEE